MKLVKSSVWVCVVLSLGVLLTGCAKPPDAEREAAKKAMESALSAGADKYAKADLEPASKNWESAESQMKEKKYKEAKEGYINAKAGFEKAAAAVAAGKKVIADQASASLTALQGAWKNLEATAKKVEKKLKDKKEAWITDAKAISESLGKAKEMIANDPVGAKAKLDEIKALVERWNNTFKEMTAPAAKSAPTPKKKK